MVEPVDDEDGGDGAGGVDGDFFVPVGTFVLGEILGREPASRKDLSKGKSLSCPYRT